MISLKFSFENWKIQKKQYKLSLESSFTERKIVYLLSSGKIIKMFWLLQITSILELLDSLKENKC